MSKPSPTNPFLFIGKSVRDEYGRQIGRVASFTTSPNGPVNGVFIEHGDGEFLRYPSNQFKMDDDGVVLLSPIKSRVKALCDDIPLIWRKDQALGDLLEKKKIPSEMFNDLHKNFENALNQLKADAQAAIENIDKQVAKCAQQITALNSAMVCLEIEHEIGKIDDTPYKTALEMIQGCLKKAVDEKSDLEAMKNKLSNMLLGEAPAVVVKTETEKENLPPPPASPTLPEPPGVVHVKA